MKYALYMLFFWILGNQGCAQSTTQKDLTLLGPVEQLHNSRPASVTYPSDYASETTYPLAIMLHGFSVNAFLQDVIFGLSSKVDSHQFVLVMPEGTENPDGDQFWNATNECCDFYHQEPDDVRYISELIEQARSHFNIDPSRIALVGHSNGGYMANRYACEQQQVVTRIVNLAGLSFVNADECKPKFPVDVLHIHGTADEQVLYESNVTDPSLSNPDVVEDDERLRAGAFELAQRWGKRADCDATPIEELAALNLSDEREGNETDVLRWQNCVNGSSLLLRANGIKHAWIDRNTEFQQLVADYVTH